MPEPLHGDSLDASLTVTDLERSATWYTTILGFAVALDTEPMTAHGHRIFRLHDPDGVRFTVSTLHPA
jgi:catechol 2,3-dioxygenase-like lactoylglutathione lyase family enzyme